MTATKGHLRKRRGAKAVAICSLKYNTLIATLELVDKICELATDLTDTELKSVSWSDFVGSLDDSTEPELITYLKERQLYINTPITAEEDD